MSSARPRSGCLRRLRPSGPWGLKAPKTGYWSAATKEVLVQKLAAYENTGYEPDEIRAAIEQAAKNSETKTATIMAECIAGAMKDTLEKYGTAGSGKKGETP